MNLEKSIEILRSKSDGGFEPEYTAQETVMISSNVFVSQEASKYDVLLHHNHQVIMLQKEKNAGEGI